MCVICMRTHTYTVTYISLPLSLLHTHLHSHTHTHSLSLTLSALQDRSLPEIIAECDADDKYIWLGVFMAYKGLLLLLGLFLAFDTRKVNLKYLGDSRRLGASIYVLGCLCLALTAVNLLLEHFVVALYAVTGGMIMLGAVFVLCLIYLRQVLLAIELGFISSRRV